MIQRFNGKNLGLLGGVLADQRMEMIERTKRVTLSRRDKNGGRDAVITLISIKGREKPVMWWIV